MKKNDEQLLLLVDMYSQFDDFRFKLVELMGGGVDNDPAGNYLFEKSSDVLSAIIGCDFNKNVYEAKDKESVARGKSPARGIWLSMKEFNLENDGLSKKEHVGDGMRHILSSDRLSASEKINRIRKVYKEMQKFVK